MQESRDPKVLVRLASIGAPDRRVLQLAKHKTLIGSEPQCELAINNSSVSRRHAIVKRCLLGGYVVKDLRSTNGTFLNGRRLRKATRLKKGDELRFGSATFVFLAPERKGLSLRTKLEAVAMLFVFGFVAAEFYVQHSSADTNLNPTAASPPRMLKEQQSESVTPIKSERRNESATSVKRTYPHSGAEWLDQLNYYRALTKLPPVTDDSDFSKAEREHAQYLVTNFAADINAGTIRGVDAHVERSANPGYTSEGALAGRRSELREGSPVPVRTMVDDWINSVFHRLCLLRPELRKVAFGQYCHGQTCASGLYSQDNFPKRALSYSSPVEFPPDGSTIELHQFDGPEWPNPLDACPGYNSPTGVPITLALGSYVPAKLSRYSLEKSGQTLDTCGFDASSYVTADSFAREMGRRTLDYLGTVAVIPRKPLFPGKYTVSMVVNDHQYTWSFFVNSSDLPLQQAASR